ncbi:NAD(P)/FAD-dependent oxidoreductase [Geminocystis sp. NIES-3709]|uniref:NAD(P)/FAD-dependent oxidoreductase n=1 Tax=Geminocystis sp. NIES-3709 TaxID=1617448 RepID=UPI0005FC5E08|nr:NAD(P)-binding protein [Geminocystis sp. NIES-3709]BAQ64526.1 amine oxidase [Geminocystis sp. NIES-3709]
MTTKIAIIGAGLSGLTIAKLLQNKQFSIDIFDKGRGVGGRMSSRRTQWGYIDHGAQYFTVKTFLFREFLQKYSSIITPWGGKFACWQDGEFISISLENSRYVPTIAMSNLCKNIAMGLKVRLETRITHLEKSTSWTLIDENDQKYLGYDFVIITAPPIQTFDLLKSHTIIADSIEGLKMYPCFSLMIIPETKLNISFDSIEFQHPILGWVAVNDSKPLRGENGAMVIQSNFLWAEENLEQNREILGKILKKTTEDIFEIKFNKILYESLHLWRYAIPQQSINHELTMLDQEYYLDMDQNIGVCGDWCLNGKIESAFLSGYHLAEKITNL